MTSNILDSLFEQLDTTLVEMTNRLFEDENNERVTKGFPVKVFTKYDYEWMKLMLMRDITKAFCNYVKISDTLEGKLEVKGCAKGTLMIRAGLRRGDSTHFINTRLIKAGGYNVQCRHYRVLVECSLPKGGDKTKLLEIQNKIKKMSAEQKVIEEIKHLENVVLRYEKEYETNSALSDEKILKTSPSYEYLIMTHDQINRGSHAWKTWKDNPTGFEEHQENERKKFISSFKRNTEAIKTEYIKNTEKRIGKLQTKLNSLKNVSEK